MVIVRVAPLVWTLLTAFVPDEGVTAVLGTRIVIISDLLSVDWDWV